MNKLIYTIILLLLLFGCKKDFSPQELLSFDFEVGNIYKYHAIWQENEELLMDNYFYVEITGDTIINGKKYFIFNNTIYNRFEDNIIYHYSYDGSEEIVFDFNVNEGDTIYFNYNYYMVKSIEEDKILNIVQKKYILENETVSIVQNDTLRYMNKYEYSTKFGYSYSLKEYFNNNGYGKRREVLVGAKIKNRYYGDM